MPTQQEYQDFYGQLAALREKIMSDRAADLILNPALADVLTKWIDDQLEAFLKKDAAAGPPPDFGFAQMLGIGEKSATDFGAIAYNPQRIDEYDETVTPERLNAVADLYYIYQHEKIGVFRVMRKLKELFEAGTLRLSSGPGAFRLYQYDKRGVLRYTRCDRLAAYRRVFGYGSARVPQGATVNSEFHHLFTHFIDEVTQYWRDKRVSEVVRERAHDPSFGSIAMVRRSGLDLRNNMKWASYGHVNVLRAEVMQLLDEAFRILGAADVMSQFGAENAWDVLEEVLTRYFNERLVSSPRQRMAVAGRDILGWLARGFILTVTRPQFEGLLNQIAGDAEEWLTSAEALGLAQRRAGRHRLPGDERSRPSNGRPRRPAANNSDREFELEHEFESEAEL
jgi:hypothetical protein